MSTTPPQTDPESAVAPSHIVGIGASAGGLEALERLFERMPVDTGMAFVVIQHLSPDFKSLMDELLSRRSQMPILRAENDMPLKANAVYLLPPRKEMIVCDGRLLLTDKDPDRLSLPIDHFLRSLAQECGRKAIAVILSGTGSDGSRGILEVSAAGGLVIVQSERSAKFDGMPCAARATGVVDISLDPEDIPEALRRYVEHPDIQQLASAFESVSAEGGDLAAVFHLLRNQHGIDFSHYKLNTVVRRTERRLQINRIESVKDYVERLRNDRDELNALYRDLLVGVTRFFREPDAFDRLGEQLDLLISQCEPHSEFRVWIAGCATGEEAYSIAILLDERLKANGKSLEARVFATDVHRASLETASQGAYSEDSVSGVSAERLATYFTQVDGGYLVAKPIRQMVVFAPHNIIKDAPFTRMNLISCRNLLIYLQPPAQKKALSLFHFGLKTGGVLFLGPSESTGDLDEEFDVLDGHWNLFRKRRDVRLMAELHEPLRVSSRLLRRSGLPEISVPSLRSMDHRLLGTYQQLLETFMPPGLLVDARSRLLHVFGDAGRYLTHRPGPTTDDALDLLDAKVRLGVAAAVRQVQNSGHEVRLKRFQLHTAGGLETVDLIIRPVHNERINATDVLISFESAPTDAGHPPAAGEGWVDLSAVSSEHVEALELELRHAKENLQALIEELETSNEELQATNEELVASNEELQSTNEELHSVNEELYTVNAEHRRKIEELTELTNDMENLLNSTHVHTVFLDRELRVRKFTPEMAGIFNLIPNDIGRSIDGFHYRINRPRLIEEMQSVLETGAPIEDEVQNERNGWFLMRILPYETAAGINGVVLTLTDISLVRQGRENLVRVLDLAPAGIVAVNPQGRIQWVNERTRAIFGYEKQELIGQEIELLIPERYRADHRGQREGFAQRPTVRDMAHGRELVGLKKGGEEFPVEVALGSIESEQGMVLLAAVADVTLRKATELELRRRDQELRLVANSVPSMVGYVDTDFIYRYVNDAYCAHYARPADQILGRHISDIVGDEVYRLKEPHLREAMAGHTESFEIKASEHGHDAWSLVRYTPDPDESGRIRGCYVTINDITPIKELVQQKERQLAQRDRFLAMLSHELRNPLGAVNNSAQLLARDASLRTETRDLVDVITRQSQHMTTLLQDLLDVARVTEGKVHLQCHPVALSLIVHETVDSFQGLFDSRRQTLQVELPEAELWVQGNPARLRQIVANLLTNANKYSPAGEVIHVLLEAEPVDDGPPQAVLRVRDRGIGIPADKLENIFEPFEQLDNRIDRSDGGLGLGLTLSRQLVQLHGGVITAHSGGPGLGSEFVVRIPMVAPPADAAGESTPPAEAPGRTRSASSLRIVLVDDNADALATLARLLQDDGHTVSTAADGTSGRDMILDLQPDVALVDIGLPGIDGYQLARAVRNDPRGRDLCLIALTGYGLPADRLYAADAGFDDHLTKPFDFAALERILETMSVKSSS